MAPRRASWSRMPSPALSAAARLTTLTNPVGTGRPASVTAPNARPTTAPSGAQTGFPNVLAEQLGLNSSSSPSSLLGGGGSDPLSALTGGSTGASLFASPQIAQALANAQKAVSSAASTVSS